MLTDLLACIMCYIIGISVTMADKDWDACMFAVGTHKALAQLQEEMQHLGEFCSDKPKSGAKYGPPDALTILSEAGEVTEGMMDTKMTRSNPSMVQRLFKRKVTFKPP